MREIKIPAHYGFNAIRGTAMGVSTVVIETNDESTYAEWLAYIAHGGTVRVDSTMNGKVLFPLKGHTLPEERGPCPSLQERTREKYLSWMLNPRWEVKEVILARE